MCMKDFMIIKMIIIINMYNMVKTIILHAHKLYNYFYMIIIKNNN